MKFETIATYTQGILRLPSVEVSTVFIRVTCVIFERAINTDVWQAMVAHAIEYHKICYQPPQASAHACDAMSCVRESKSKCELF